MNELWFNKTETCTDCFMAHCLYYSNLGFILSVWRAYGEEGVCVIETDRAEEEKKERMRGKYYLI